MTVSNLRQRIQADFELAREHLGGGARRRKERYDVGISDQTFQLDQLVWYFYPRRRQGLSPKWQKFYVGPYRVVRLLDSHNVVIRRNSRSKCLVVHRDKLKPCYGELNSSSDNGRTPTVVVQTPETVVVDDGRPQTLENVAQLPATADDRAEWADCWQSPRTRPRRIMRRLKYLNEYLVHCVCRTDDRMANEMVKRVRAGGTVYNSSGHVFSNRCNLEKHLKRVRGDPFTLMEHSHSCSIGCLTEVTDLESAIPVKFCFPQRRLTRRLIQLM